VSAIPAVTNYYEFQSFTTAFSLSSRTHIEGFRCPGDSHVVKIRIDFYTLPFEPVQEKIFDKVPKKFTHLPVLQFNTMGHLEKNLTEIMIAYSNSTLTIGKFTHALKAHTI
jgi:hypothetical protein